MSVEKDNPIKAEKRRKLNDLRKLGINPYPHNFEKKHSVEYLKSKYSHLKATEHDEAEKIQTAGRVMTVRLMGKAAFFNLQDQTGVIQVYLKTTELEEKDAQVFDLIDLGDIVGVEGTMFSTKTGELTIKAKSIKMLCKTLEPLPDKHAGLSDVEIKYRARYLDLLQDPTHRKVFEVRTKVIQEIRNYLNSKGFLEVETPILQPIYGGAAAHPFITHHRALDMRLYLKISPELYLKRLIVGGFEKVYDMGKCFRNEGIDRSHNPEFSMVEWYEAYTDYQYQMKQFEDLVAHVAKKICGTTKIKYQGVDIDLTPPWKRLTMVEAIKEYAKVDVEKLNDDEIFKNCKENGSELEKKVSRGELLAELFKLTTEKHLIQPTFILDHPKEICPLTKDHRTKKGLVERFEPFICGMEIGNSYTELNDPEEQLARLTEQEAKRKNDDEAHPMDEDFVRAIEVGMPPTGGVGLGIERIVMLLTDQHSIRDIILFPTMRPLK